ncbi:MAG: DUF1538 domain-containing protein [Ruminococcaceae bacterium]|nr:DUF1538 domain-containing protein [Oscillospiraceae bacterium]
MLKTLLHKCREALVSVLPVTLIVLVLYVTPFVTLTALELCVFLLSSLFLVLGIGLFNLGADMAMTPMGVQVGAGLSKSRQVSVLLSVSFLLGVLITVAEPDLSVLATQVSAVLNGTALIVTVGVGVGLFLILAILRIVTKTGLSKILMIFYMMVFALAALVLERGGGGFLALAFDSGGVTTGPITVPFIMALGAGIATTLGGKDAGENSFGLVALCSIGPVLAVMLLGLFADGSMVYTLPDYSVGAHLGAALLNTVIGVIREVGLALGLLVAFFAVMQVLFLRQPRRRLYRIGVGILYTFLGLVMFLSAVTVGFMPIGYRVGYDLTQGNHVFLVMMGFLLGLVVVLAEPAIHVLKRQVEDITNGTVSKNAMMLALSIGVGVSIGLSMIRIIFDFSILYYLIPGYFLSLGLSFFVPRLYTAIAFDSGGVASGPLTSSFILPLAVGACVALQGVPAVMQNAFGIVAMVAMTPLITIQVMGFRAVMAGKVRDSIMMKQILGADDAQIIDFM